MAGARVEPARPAVDFAEAFEIYAFLNFAIGFAGASRETRAQFAEKAREFDAARPELSRPAGAGG